MRTELRRVHCALGGRHSMGWSAENLAGDDAGGDGSPLLLLHGFGDNAGTWLPMLARPELAERTVLAVDLPGFGSGDDLDPDEPVMSQLEDFVASAVTDLRVRTGRPVTVVGNSLGGALALRVAMRQPDDVARVVALCPAGEVLANWLQRAGASAALGWAAAALPLPAPLLRTGVAAFYSLTVPARPAFSGRQAARTFAAGWDRRHAMGALRTARRLLPELANPVDLSGVRCPTLLVFAGHDRLVPLRAGDTMAASLPAAHHVVLPDAGHCVQAEHPARLATMIAAFCRGEVPEAGVADSPRPRLSGRGRRRGRRGPAPAGLPG